MNTYEPLRVAEEAVTARPGHPATAVLGDAPDTRLVVFRIEPGQAIAPHSSTSSVILSIMEGSGLVSGAEGERSARAGNVVAFAPNETHGMRALSHRFVVLAIITPRPDA